LQGLRISQHGFFDTKMLRLNDRTRHELAYCYENHDSTSKRLPLELLKEPKFICAF